MKWKFEPSDFDDQLLMYGSTLIACEKANRKLDEWRKHATVVYNAEGVDDGEAWEKKKYIDATHRALLIDIEPLHKEPCKHEPYTITNSPDIKCRHCGVKLKARWEAE